MTEDTVSYLADQLAMFDGGYETITATFRMHITGTEQTAHIGLSLYETATHQPVAIQTPVIVCPLGDAQEMAAQLTEAIRQVYALVLPF